MKTRPIVLFISILLASLVFACLSYGKIAPASAVGVWLFNDGKGNIAKDASGKGNDGTLKNGPAWIDGKFGKALQFDGVDDYVDIADTDKLSGVMEKN